MLIRRDRLARSVPDARDIGDSLAARGVALALGRTLYDLADPIGKMFFNILATFAEFEVDLLRLRTREGMAIAKSKGKLRVSASEFALGAMMFGAWGNTDHDESVRMIHTALDASINFVDTADIYSEGASEEIVGKALKGRRDDVVLATKFGLPMGPDANQRGGSPRWIIRAVEDSLRRLGTDHVDLYQMHRPDPDTDLDETLSALSDLVRSGKVRAIGSSTFPAELIVEAQWTAQRRGHHRFRTEQPPYSILAWASSPPCCRPRNATAWEY